MRILHLIATVDPAHGGPIEYARIMAETHRAMGHKSVFVTLDRINAKYLSNFPFDLHACGPAEGPIGTNLAYDKTLRRLARSSDVAIVHGLWNGASIGGYRAMRDAGLPWLLFPHGMLDPYLARIKPLKHWAKVIYWLLFQGRMLSAAHRVLFTCQEELDLARKSFPTHQNYARRVIAFCAADQQLTDPQMADGKARFESRLPALEGRRYFLFLSRIHPKKACDNLIAAYAALANSSRYPEAIPDLVIAGPDSVGWKEQLKVQAKQLGVDARVHWPGQIRDSEKAAAYANAEAFVLPSHQENFGLVVAEALSLGRPVLISNKVNIWNEIIEAGAGLAETDTLEATVRLLERFMALNSAQRTRMQAAARALYEERFSVSAAAGELLRELHDAAAHHSTRDLKR